MGYLNGALEHQKEGKKKLIFFFWFFAMMSSFRGCFKVDFGLSWDGFCAMFMVDLWS